MERKTGKDASISAHYRKHQMIFRRRRGLVNDAMGKIRYITKDRRLAIDTTI